jgi:hypothetical protein
MCVASFCGLNSHCQVYQPNRAVSCSGVDYTVGVFDGGDAFDADAVQSEVVTFEEWTASTCVEDAMCLEASYSSGSCFDFSRFAAQMFENQYCSNQDDYYASITEEALTTLITDGYITGSTDGDNGACLNFCFSKAVEDGVVDNSEGFYDMVNIIAESEFAYAIRGEECRCYLDCPDLTTCG